ncbi:MAG: SGNH hydrolase domain-containing protein [Oxalobacter sp.]
MMALGGAGYAIFNDNGLPERFPKEVQTLQRLLAQKFHDKNSGFKTSCYAELKDDTDYKECRNLPENTIDPNKKSIVIWGDSQAAAFVPGFKKHFTSDFNIIQRTKSGCPAIGRDASPECAKTVTFVLNEIKQIQPSAVILSARWGLKQYKNSIQNFNKTINELKEYGIRTILVIGPVPDWQGILPKEVLLYYRKKGRFPFRMDKLNKERTYTYDNKIGELSYLNNVNYVSPVKLLCNSEGCQTMDDNDIKNIFYFDESHLTNYGAEYTVGKMKEQIKNILK